jgi:hypothetical protein
MNEIRHQQHQLNVRLQELDQKQQQNQQQQQNQIIRAGQQQQFEEIDKKVQN